MKKAFVIILAVICLVTPFVVYGNAIYKSIVFDVNCADYLKLAADANNLDIAEKHLTTAITYLESKGLTSGDTRLWVYSPKNDIGLWYENLRAAQAQLREKVEEGYTELEQSNLLMKLRETLLDENGSVTSPLFISFVPNHSETFWTLVFVWLLWVACGVLFCWASEMY